MTDARFHDGTYGGLDEVTGVGAASREVEKSPRVDLVDSSEPVENVVGVASFRTLAILLWAASVIPSAVLLLSGSGRVWNETIAYTPATQALRNVLVYAVMGWSLIIILRHGTQLLRRPFGTIALVALALFYPALSGYFHEDGSADELFIAFVSLVVVLAVFSLRLHTRVLSIVGGLGALTAAVSLLMAWRRPETAFVVEGGGRVLAGPFDNSNYLGTVLILSLPFALLIRRKIVRFVSILLIAAPILMGGSTTSIVTLGVFALIGVLMFLFRAPLSRARILGVAGGIALLATMILPHVVNDAGAFTSRGAIWALANQKMMDFIPFGAGEEWFEANSRSTGFSINHAHNMLLHPLIVGGLPYLGAVLALIILLLVFGVRLTARGGSIAPAAYAVMLIVAGAVGSFFILDARDLRYLATGFVVVTLLSIATARRTSDAD